MTIATTLEGKISFLSKLPKLALATVLVAAGTNWINKEKSESDQETVIKQIGLFNNAIKHHKEPLTDEQIDVLKSEFIELLKGEFYEEAKHPRKDFKYKTPFLTPEACRTILFISEEIVGWHIPEVGESKITEAVFKNFITAIEGEPNHENWAEEFIKISNYNFV